MKILIVQFRRIGDVLLTTPVIGYLAESRLGAQIDFLVEPGCHDVLKGNPHINEILLYDKKNSLGEMRNIRKRRYDAVLDFMNNPRSAYITGWSGARWRVGFRHPFRSLFYNVNVPVPVDPEYVPLRKIRMVRHWLDAMTRPAPPPQRERPQLFLSAEEDGFAADWMKKEQTRPGQFAVLAPAHRHLIRQWRLDGFRAAGLHLARRHGLKVYLAWGPGEEERMGFVRAGCDNELKLLPPTTLRQMAAVFKQAKLVVTNDSGAMHLAVAVNAPTVTVYGPTRPVDWNPTLIPGRPSLTDIALTAKDVPCLGCHLSACPVGHLCMKNLKDVDVREACDVILGR